MIYFRVYGFGSWNQSLMTTLPASVYSDSLPIRFHRFVDDDEITIFANLCSYFLSTTYNIYELTIASP